MSSLADQFLTTPAGEVDTTKIIVGPTPIIAKPTAATYEKCALAGWDRLYSLWWPLLHKFALAVVVGTWIRGARAHQQAIATHLINAGD
ncbi:hypothetical protein [Mycobacterium lepromatosis]|uniref:hypothetical protein n=1 Tax=Mycobacterium lepromatosis TaxID=480418 RepID=UPI000678CF5B|nr:hypothetical protein [Mycobacterium lepromatosis]